MPRKQIPDFKSETEEARWWAEHQDDLDEYTETEPENPTPLREELELPPLEESKAAIPAQPITIRVQPSDIRKARQYASRKGIKYQLSLLQRTPLKSLPAQPEGGSFGQGTHRTRSNRPSLPQPS